MRTRFINIALLLIALICPWSAWAAPAHVQSPSAATAFSGTTINLAYGSNVTAGSLLSCWIYANNGISGVADSRSQTFSSAINVTDGATYSLANYYFPNTTGGAAELVTVLHLHDGQHCPSELRGRDHIHQHLQ